jgi:hypothetical protein
MQKLTPAEIAALEQVQKDEINFYVWPNGGGLVEHPNNVSVSARISGNARVSGDARVSGNAQVYGNARVFGNAQISGSTLIYVSTHVCGAKLKCGYIESCQSFIQLYGLGTHCLTAVKHEGEIFLTKGCFSGSIEQARIEAEQVYGEKGMKLLEAMLSLIEKHFEIYPPS